MMEAAERAGAIYWAITVAIGFAGILLRDRLTQHSLAATLICAALHPAWWMSVSSGDCGFTKQQISPVFALIAAGCIGVGLIQMRTNAIVPSGPIELPK